LHPQLVRQRHAEPGPQHVGSHQRDDDRLNQPGQDQQRDHDRERGPPVAADHGVGRQRSEHRGDDRDRHQSGRHGDEPGRTADGQVRQGPDEHADGRDRDHLLHAVPRGLVLDPDQQRVGEGARGGDRRGLPVAWKAKSQQFTERDQRAERERGRDIEDAVHGGDGDGRDEEHARHDEQQRRPGVQGVAGVPARLIPLPGQGQLHALGDQRAGLAVRFRQDLRHDDL
jgi:hypothetical protein